MTTQVEDSLCAGAIYEYFMMKQDTSRPLENDKSELKLNSIGSWTFVGYIIGYIQSFLTIF
jgi:hypothetical protein